ncbi:hypothetical protein M413DRAFT_6855 [Hebeloma cylindrosporum]|uniref:Uncharacterized protein n=1 Tax=Hebeloma cylindrosporum TaxID=76867 RepID=A0A0C2YCL3_HEBCY|nr:hypothetical protein M413DRAFT_6855 [Hebeloma cylindrosporum h7]
MWCQKVGREPCEWPGFADETGYSGAVEIERLSRARDQPEDSFSINSVRKGYATTISADAHKKPYQTRASPRLAIQHPPLRADTGPPWRLTQPGYVKGFFLDREKIRKKLGVEADNDPEIFDVMYIIMRDYIDEEKHWLCLGTRANEDQVIVVSLGEGSFGEDPDELMRKNVPVPEYLSNFPSALTGPEVFRFRSW